MFKLDLKLEEYATEKQWEKLIAWQEHGSQRNAAKALKVEHKVIHAAKAAVYKKAADHGYSPDHDWTRPVPDGHRVKGVSTYYDKEGKAAGQWVKSERDKERQQEMFNAMVKGFTDTLPKALPVLAPKPDDSFKRLMACYPISDHHMGMLAWKHETNDSYDLDIGERLLNRAMSYLVNVAPSCREAVIITMGDMMHYDSFETVTPSSRNMLDADSRFPKMVRYTVRAIRYAITVVLMHHEHVRVIVEIGNHDLSCSIFLMECLYNVYENEPRVTIDTSPKHFHYFRHGKVLVGTHHGHSVRMPNLPLLMAQDRPQDWGETTYRYIWTGHVHKDQTNYAKAGGEFAGVKVESFRVLAPGDAWAQQQGYRSMQDMKCIVLHDQYGEVARHTVNPEMLKGENDMAIERLGYKYG